MKRFALLALLVIVLFSVIAPAALAQAGSPVQVAAEQYFAGGTKNIKAADLFANLNDGDAANDPMRIDIRKAEDYANGHIPGAINMPGTSIFTAENLAKLPKDKQIVLNCYSGQTASQSVSALRMMGYDAYNLLYGVPSWGTNDKVTYPFKAEQSGNYTYSKDATQLDGNFAAPKPLGETVEGAALAYFAGGFKATKAADLFANLNDGDDSNNPVILDVRKPEDYAAGHIPGAVNVAVKDLFTTAMLAKLPADKQIVAYCYSGQTASQATSALRMLGYDAYNMQFGMPAWAIIDETSTPVWNVSKSLNQPLVLGSEPIAAAAPAADAAAAPAPAALPTTGAPLFSLILAGLGLTGAGLALRKR